MKNLNLGKVYNLLETYKEEWNFCEHCGRGIRNVCVIENENKKTFKVWSQCVKNILELDGSDYFKNREICKQINKYFAMLLVFKKASKIVYNDCFVGVKLKNKKWDIKIKFYFLKQCKNVDKKNWEYNNTSDTDCFAAMDKYLRKYIINK